MALTFHSQYAGRVGIETALHPRPSWATPPPLAPASPHRASIHLCSPLLIQLHTPAPAIDVADRFLIILSLSAHSSVCFESHRSWNDRQDSRPREPLQPRHTPGPMCDQHVSSVQGRSLQVMHEAPGNWRVVFCFVFSARTGSIFKYLVYSEALLRRSWRCKITPGSWDGSLHSIWDPSLHSWWSGSQYSQTSPGALRKGRNGEKCWQIDNQLKARRSESHMSPRRRR